MMTCVEALMMDEGHFGTETLTAPLANFRLFACKNKKVVTKSLFVVTYENYLEFY